MAEDPVTATAPLTDEQAVRVLIEIRRLYALAEHLPYKLKPSTISRLQVSPAYTALEGQIKALCDQYRAWEALQPRGRRRMAKASLRPYTSDEDDDDRHAFPRRHQDR